MPCINPFLLRHYRAKQNLSQEDLSRQSHIDKGTIFRIESGKMKRNGARVIGALSKALKVEPAQLTAANAEGIEPPTDDLFPKTQLNLRSPPRFAMLSRSSVFVTALSPPRLSSLPLCCSTSPLARASRSGRSAFTACGAHGPKWNRSAAALSISPSVF